ncbi:CfaE/CblD family pilus tip adhesin [Stenotrophomonas geniculata]|uniref:CfaE/CblD family pilus tip adhesin n=1 Tax=Stenotrophomonas geniculata TaxID=86188 RepID=UPI0029490F80|nr:CfaE/CblD family pilus tip adhesin [Stenotrophomonas geniculata]MDV6191450.1 CfaE/CblD family pilus tip adhesin [Stenotrophomonas geniculata]
MNRRVWWVMAVLCALVVLAPRAMAQQPPETHPTSEHRDIVMSWDRSAMPGDIELWAPRTVLGYELPGTLDYGSLYLTCNSSSDAATGRCPVNDTLENATNLKSVIPLRFTEQRSGMTEELEVTADLRRGDATVDCSLDYWDSSTRYIWSSTFTPCFGKPVGTAVSMEIQRQQLERLVAGKWKAQLALSLHTPSHSGIATYKFDFELAITDYNAVSIYFPLFDQVTPHVGLNLQYDPIAQTVGGRTQLDMCLYDGLGSQSQYLGVTVRDSGPRPPGPSGYSVWHTDGGSDATQRVDYTVTLDHNGSAIPLRNGVEQLLHGIDTAKLRLVLLPGMTQPVFCVPTPLTLDTPRVPVSSKRPGYYDGDLKVELRVPTVTP